METKFDLEIWPNTKMIKTIYLTCVLIAVIAWIAFVIGSIFWDEYTYTVTNLRGISYQAGWPAKLYWIGLYTGIIAPVAALIVYLMVDRKNPSLAVSKAGLFINQQMIKQTTVEWSDIARIEKSVNGGKVTVDIHFKDAQKIIDAQAAAKKAFLKENLKDGKPLTVENRLTIGDLAALADKANAYLA